MSKASNTDPFQMGVDILVGRSHCATCPVMVVVSYIVGVNVQLGYKRGQCSPEDAKLKESEIIQR